MRTAAYLAVSIILVSLLVFETAEIKKKDKAARKPFKDRIELLRTRVKRWHCHGPYGGGGGGFGGGGGGGFGGGGGGGFGGGRGYGGGGGGGLLGGLGDMDPTTLVLLALMSGVGGGAVAPVGIGGLGGGIGANIAPMQPTVPLKSPNPDQPVLKSIDEQTETAQQSSSAGQTSGGTGKLTGYVTPGNRCADTAECVPNAECVEALRQKYCVCAQGKRPKGGICA